MRGRNDYRIESRRRSDSVDKRRNRRSRSYSNEPTLKKLKPLSNPPHSRSKSPVRNRYRNERRADNDRRRNRDRNRNTDRKRERSIDRDRHRERERRPLRDRQEFRPAKSVLPASCELRDEELPDKNDDPRRLKKLDLKGLTLRGTGRNTESFDPVSTIVRPEMRIQIGSNKSKTYNKKMKHDDVIVVPELFCEEGDHTLYYKLVEELREIQKEELKETGEKIEGDPRNRNAGAEWIPWHEGCHLVTKHPEKSKTFQMVLKRVSEYFSIREGSQGTRFNWYRDSSDWKPFHHDSAAFNQQRAKNQNITVGISFGAERELSFLHAENKTKVYFPQTNGMAFTFGKDVNIRWKHGINALPADEQSGQGRISIILWGWCDKVIDEHIRSDGSPEMLTNDKRRIYDGRQRNQNRDTSNIPCRDFQAGRCNYNNCRFKH